MSKKAVVTAVNKHQWLLVRRSQEWHDLEHLGLVPHFFFQPEYNPSLNYLNALLQCEALGESYGVTTCLF